MNMPTPSASTSSAPAETGGRYDLRDYIAGENEAGRILAVCRHYSFRDLENLSCLYLGGGDDLPVEYLRDSFRSLDVATAEEIAERTDGSIGVPDHSMDVVICDRFYGLVENPAALMSEIYRCLKYDGFCYFSAYNKMSIVERHYSMPFLSWLPRRFATNLLRKSGKGDDYSIRLLTINKLKRLTDNFWRHDYIGLIRQNPHVFRTYETSDSGGFRLKAPGHLFKYIYPFLPLWIWILTKKK